MIDSPAAVREIEFMIGSDVEAANTAGMEPHPTIDKRTLDERVYDQLRDAIMGGAFSAGHVVTLRGLAEAFGTSLMPVRNAVNRLTVENALVALPNRSISVPRLSIAEFDEMTEIRVALESQATRRAAMLMSPGELKRIAALDERMGKAEAAEYFRLNRAFHFSIYAAAERPVLFRLIQGGWLRIGPLLNSLEAHTTELPNARHDWTISALRRRDPEDAAASIAADIRSAAHVLRVLIEKTILKSQSGKAKLSNETTTYM